MVIFINLNMKGPINTFNLKKKFATVSSLFNGKLKLSFKKEQHAKRMSSKKTIICHSLPFPAIPCNDIIACFFLALTLLRHILKFLFLGTRFFSVTKTCLVLH